MRHGIGWMLQIGVRALWATAVRPPWSTGYAAAFSGADYARPARAPEGRGSRLALSGPTVTCRPALVALAAAANTEPVIHEISACPLATWPACSCCCPPRPPRPPNRPHSGWSPPTCGETRPTSCSPCPTSRVRWRGISMGIPCRAAARATRWRLSSPAAMARPTASAASRPARPAPA